LPISAEFHFFTLFPIKRRGRHAGGEDDRLEANDTGLWAA
jgi:hypothetical protein